MAGGNSCSKTKCYWTEVWENFTIKMAKHWNRLPREDSLYLEVLTFHVSTLSYLPAKLALLCIGSWVKQTPELGEANSRLVSVYGSVFSWHSARAEVTYRPQVRPSPSLRYSRASVISWRLVREYRSTHNGTKQLCFGNWVILPLFNWSSHLESYAQVQQAYTDSNLKGQYWVDLMKINPWLLF